MRESGAFSCSSGLLRCELNKASLLAVSQTVSRAHHASPIVVVRSHKTDDAALAA